MEPKFGEDIVSHRQKPHRLEHAYGTAAAMPITAANYWNRLPVMMNNR